MEKLFVFIRVLETQLPPANQRDRGAAPNPGVYGRGANGSRESVPSPERGSLLGSLSHLHDYSGCSPAEPYPFLRCAQREPSVMRMRGHSRIRSKNPLLLRLIPSIFAQPATPCMSPMANWRMCLLLGRHDLQWQRHNRIFNSIASRIASSASAFPRASSTGWCVWRVFRRCLKFFEVSRTSPL